MAISGFSRGEQTRFAILHAAHDLFIEQGYHGTSMRQIARDAGIALSGLYNHFTSKEAVFAAVFQTFHPYHQVLSQIQAAQGANLEQLMKDAIQRMVQVVEGRPDFMNLMFIEMVEFKSVHARQLFDTQFSQGMQIFQHLVEAHPDQIRAIPSPMVVRTLLGLFIGYYLTDIAFAPSAPTEFHEYALQYFMDVYLHGVLAHQEMNIT